MEWDRPQKFRGSKQTGSQWVYPDHSVVGLLGETSKGLELMKGRQHFSEQYGSPMKWRPSLKPISFVPKSLQRRGIGIPEKIITEAKPRAEMRHISFQSSQRRSPEFPAHLKMVYSYDGTRIQEVPTKEFNLQLGRKLRITDIFDKRNQINYTTLGDKPYNRVERSPGFYKSGGLIVGSSNTYRHPHGSRLSESNFSTVLSYDATNPNRVKWTERVQTEVKNEENQAVRDLVGWEKTILKEANPKLVDPDLSDGD